MCYKHVICDVQPTEKVQYDIYLEFIFDKPIFTLLIISSLKWKSFAFTYKTKYFFLLDCAIFHFKKCLFYLSNNNSDNL